MTPGYLLTMERCQSHVPRVPEVALIARETTILNVSSLRLLRTLVLCPFSMIPVTFERFSLSLLNIVGDVPDPRIPGHLHADTWRP